MAANTKTPVATPLTRAEAVAIALSLRPAAAATPAEELGASRLSQFFGNRVANARVGVAAIAAGWEQGGARYAAAYQLETLRQAEKTAELVLKLDEQRRRLGIQ